MYVQSFEDASQFLARALPWPMSGEPNWFIGVHHPWTPPNALKPVFPGRACTTVKEAVNHVQWLMTLDGGKGTDAYVCMSAQSEATQRATKKGTTWMAAKRHAANAIWHKSLYVDVDVKEGFYTSTQQAAQEFGRIRRAIGLPPPSIVILSGSGGFHAHWIFVEPIRGLRFLKLAHALVAALKSHGFVGDTGCTTDASRILRIPNTLNHKHNPPKPVTVGSNSGNDYLVEMLEDVLAPYVGIVTTKVTSQPPLDVTSLVISSKFKGSALAGSDLAEGIVTTIPLSAVERVCPWVANTLATGGVSNNNPLWLASTNLSLFLDEGREACHAMANGHATYTVDETDALFDRQQVTKLQRNLGWPQCRSISNNGATECTACPHLVHNKSPLNFALMIAAPTLPPPVSVSLSPAAAMAASVTSSVTGVPSTLPDGYAYMVNGSAGIVGKVTADENGTQTLNKIHDVPMTNAWLQPNPATLHFETVDVSGNPKNINIPIEFIGDQRPWSNHLSKQFFPVHTRDMKEVMTFHSSWVQKLKHDRATTKQSVPFGWLIEDGERMGFVYGGHLWYPGGSRPAGKVDSALAANYTPVGSLQPYLDAHRMLLAQQRPAGDALQAVSYASPLVALIGQTGFILSVYSQESGIQKSSALKTNASVWGHPSLSMQQLSATINSVFRRAGMLRHLPIVWDEVRAGSDANKFSDFVFQLSGGVEKSRLKANTEFQTVGDWATIMVGASNTSLLDSINKANKATEAGAMRIFEYAIPKATQGIISTADATMMVSLLDNNYGIAGLHYAKFLGENFDVIRDETLALLKSYEVTYKAKPEERFWFALVACLQQGAIYANQVVGTSFDLVALEEFLIDTLQGMRVSKLDATVNMRDPMNLSEMLSRYLNYQRSEHTVITDVHVAHTAKATAALKSDFTRLKEVHVHLAEDGHLRLRLAAFNEWLEDQKLPTTIIINELKNQFGGAYTKQSRLAWGTNFMTQPDQCLTFNVRHAGFPAGWAPY